MKVKVKLPNRPKEPPPPPPDGPKQPTRLARMLALAHLVERRVESGELRDYAAAARTLGISRARMTQLMNLLVLSPMIQERILTGENAFSERGLRPLLCRINWRDQTITSVISYGR